MKLAICLILLGLFQIGAGGFYGLLAPIRTEENIQFYINQATSAAEERLRKEISPGFAERWPADFELSVRAELREIEGLAQSARQGWRDLELASYFLAGGGFFCLIVGIILLKSEPVAGLNSESLRSSP